MQRSEAVVLLTVADPSVGLGHLYRCDALAQALQRFAEARVELVVACKSGEAWLAERAPGSQYRVSAWNVDAATSRSAIESADLVVVDSYVIHSDVWSELRARSARLAVFDDTGEKPPFVGTLINGSPGAHSIRYPKIDGQNLLLGTDYQVLRPPFWERSERIVRPEVRTAVIMAGGTDHQRVASQVARIAISALPDSSKIVLVGGRAAATPPGVVATGFVGASEIKELFEEADLIISAAGQSVAEAVSCSLPTIMIQTADNQAINYDGWSQTGAALAAGNVSDALWNSSLRDEIEALARPAPRRHMAKVAQLLALFQSSERLARALIGTGRSLSVVSFQELPQDLARLVLEWRNDSRIRQWMDNQGEVSLEHHRQFIRSLSDRKDRQYFVVFSDGHPIGVINLTNISAQSGEAELGLYRRPDEAGQGYGALLLSAVEDKARAIGLAALNLKVRNANTRACWLYENHGYRATTSDEEYVYMKKELHV